MSEPIGPGDLVECIEPSPYFKPNTPYTVREVTAEHTCQCITFGVWRERRGDFHNALRRPSLRLNAQPLRPSCRGAKQMTVIETKLCAAERAIRELYFAIKDEPDPDAAEPFGGRLADLADKAGFTAFSAKFRGMCGHVPHTEPQVFDPGRPF